MTRQTQVKEQVEAVQSGKKTAAARANGLKGGRPKGIHTTNRKKTITRQIKAKIAIEALKGFKTVDEIARDFNVLPAQVTHWKNILQEQAPRIFDIDHNPKPVKVSDTKRLNSEIMRLGVQLNWLMEKSGINLPVICHYSPEGIDED